MKFTVDEFISQLPLPANDKWKDGVWDIEPFEIGNVRLVFFAPRGVDYQTFHDEDEFYFIAAGTAELIIREERRACTAGDAFFVAAKMPHHFERMSGDFASWAIFF